VGRLPDPAKATQKKAPPKPNPATVETLAKAETPPAKLTPAPIERTRLRQRRMLVLGLVTSAVAFISSLPE
jgi:hypothetical protein